MQGFFIRKEQELGVALNEAQKQAVAHTDGALLLLAAPGSGKTTTLIMRIGYLIEEKGVQPSRIKAVTFSRAAAADMQERYRRFFPQLPLIDFSTIHSLAYEVTRDYLKKQGVGYQIIEGNVGGTGQGHPRLHKRIILRKLFQKIVGESITDDQLDELTTYISYVKNKLIPRDKWAEVKIDVPKAERILRGYEAFKRKDAKRLLLDYDDMLTLANHIFDSDEQLLGSYQQRFDYVLTDESQDTSLVQHAIIEKLIRPHGNLCVVADDDQSIYSWRGAEPAYLLQFKEFYPDATILYMEQNYRSSKQIVDVANQFIQRNRQRYNKKMFTENPAREPIQIQSFVDHRQQTTYLVEHIKQHGQFSDVAVLYRNHSSSIALMNQFDRAGIPFYMKDADNRFFSHWIVEDILNFMRMTFTDKRVDILEKIHLKFNGYISKRQMEALKDINNDKSVFDNLLRYFQMPDYQIKRLKASKNAFQQMKGMPPLQAIHVIRGKLGYEKALERMCEHLGFNQDYLFGILNTLEQIATTLPSMEAFAQRLTYLETELKRAQKRKDQNVVTFSTLHSAKGLEFEQVYMIDLLDGILPSASDQGDAALMEEAARLFYVGMTRAKTRLQLLSYQQIGHDKTAESSFVTVVKEMINRSEQRPNKEQRMLNPNAIQDRQQLFHGAVVKHHIFGNGSILRVTDEQVHIQFQDTEKVLSINTCLKRGLLEPV
ncbi:DNA helicase UvrD [Ammoniphilus oxalaticus]|uniref:DNA 3'-5' helicase n=1 Tax=Ammoniphilus oxalaticus TaxID=66863 RepID=A0A419SK46_9BACL|nr:ATP-dependent helicase [Ammoniphilus oxalaticus]RKD24352.1 DNA helicase UvrD [Ammoniphilus oxalaticus]